MAESFIADSALVSPLSSLGKNLRIWHQSQIREESTIGDNVIIGRNVYIGPGVEIGMNTKIQNNALIYEPAKIGIGVFIGPGVIFTNDRYPRSINPDYSQKGASDWDQVGVEVGDGAAIGAGVICIAPVKIGLWASIGAGAVVTKNVKNFALVVGSPARQIGWVGKAGILLREVKRGEFVCPDTNENYAVEGDELIEKF